MFSMYYKITLVLRILRIFRVQNWWNKFYEWKMYSFILKYIQYFIRYTFNIYSWMTDEFAFRYIYTGPWNNIDHKT